MDFTLIRGKQNRKYCCYSIKNSIVFIAIIDLFMSNFIKKEKDI